MHKYIHIFKKVYHLNRVDMNVVKNYNALEKVWHKSLTFYFEGYVAEGHGHELVTKPIATCYLASK